MIGIGSTWTGVNARLAIVAVAALIPLAAGAATLDKVRETGKLTLGYEPDARPFSYEEGGKPAGYSVALCEKVVDAVKAEVGRSDLPVEWVAVAAGDRFAALKDGRADLMCGSDSVTLAARRDVGFSIPIFPSGVGALLRADSPVALREVLEQGHPSDRPIWRGSPARTVLETETFAAVAGTTTEGWLKDRASSFRLSSNIASVDGYAAGVEQVIDGSVSVLFGDLPILLDAAKRSSSSGDLIVLDRHFTYQPIALALPRGDEDFRLVVDRALSGLYRSDGFRDFFEDWFGPPDETLVTFFRQTTLPD